MASVLLRSDYSLCCCSLSHGVDPLYCLLSLDLVVAFRRMARIVSPYAYLRVDKSTEWSTIPACPSLMCFFNRGDPEGTNSSEILCPMFVYVLFYVGLCHGLFFGLWIICGLMTCVQSK